MKPQYIAYHCDQCLCSQKRFIYSKTRITGHLMVIILFFSRHPRRLINYDPSFIRLNGKRLYSSISCGWKKHRNGASWLLTPSVAFDRTLRLAAQDVWSAVLWWTDKRTDIRSVGRLSVGACAVSANIINWTHRREHTPVGSEQPSRTDVFSAFSGLAGCGRGFWLVHTLCPFLVLRVRCLFTASHSQCLDWIQSSS